MDSDGMSQQRERWARRRDTLVPPHYLRLVSFLFVFHLFHPSESALDGRIARKNERRSCTSRAYGGTRAICGKFIKRHREANNKQAIKGEEGSNGRPYTVGRWCRYGRWRERRENQPIGRPLRDEWLLWADSERPVSDLMAILHPSLSLFFFFSWLNSSRDPLL